MTKQVILPALAVSLTVSCRTTSSNQTLASDDEGLPGFVSDGPVPDIASDPDNGGIHYTTQREVDLSAANALGKFLHSHFREEFAKFDGVFAIGYSNISLTEYNEFHSVSRRLGPAPKHDINAESKTTIKVVVASKELALKVAKKIAANAELSNFKDINYFEHSFAVQSKRPGFKVVSKIEKFSYPIWIYVDGEGIQL
jgi:hypothetical protein